ncbi:DUF2637 domain-containing protein [Micromonospora chokoriensis]|uniref:DUF2637 domain-containing protein n=1 Tax=Micromonospora chokoriensis TaxID=356851 RepID=A0A1C4WNS9_9ACTN|nr:DUF2637 domain-containing protein [Micromonospora chokoriensis]SCE97824.1 Protein of unknown function [Micromonospora chokoriensis]
MMPTRLARDVSTVAVAGIAAWSSWSHMVAVALRFGERPEVAYVLPLSVDGMLVVASAAMVEDKRAGRRVRWSARTAFVVGVAASVAANIAAAEPSLGARIVAAWPAVALLLVVEMLTRSTPVLELGSQRDDLAAEDGPARRRQALTDVEQATPSASEIGKPPEGVQPVPVVERSTAGGEPAEPLRRSAGTTRDRRRESGKRTADTVARLRAERPDASLIEVASAAGVSPRHVRRLIADELESTRTNGASHPIKEQQ